MKRKFTKEHQEWREKVLSRDNYKCVVCGNGPRYLNAHHLVPSLFKEYQFFENNGVTLCPTCHTLGKFSAHKNPLWFTDWLKKHYPKLYFIAMERLNEN